MAKNARTWKGGRLMSNETICCAELKRIEGVRCSRPGSVRRDGEWFCSFHDPGPKMLNDEAELMRRFAHVEITPDGQP